MAKKAALTPKSVPKLGLSVKMVPRSQMRGRKVKRKFRAEATPLPATALPVDSTGGARVLCPMDGNDRLGDCMEAMACHVDNVLTFRQGQAVQSSFDERKLEQQYLAASGGDYGLDEETLLDECWKPGLAGQAEATYVDALDIDVTNVQHTQYAIDHFYAVCLMWSVPDAFIREFATGQVFASPGIPDTYNGHGTPLFDVAGPSDTAHGVPLTGFYRLYTWGTWCWVSPAFVASVDPEAFVVFSERQFSKATGLDSKGRHITTQAAAWVACGGHPIPPSVLASYPPVGTPPVPVPIPPIPPVVVAWPDFAVDLSGVVGTQPASMKGTLVPTVRPVPDKDVVLAALRKLKPPNVSDTDWAAIIAAILEILKLFLGK